MVACCHTTAFGVLVLGRPTVRRLVQASQRFVSRSSTSCTPDFPPPPNDRTKASPARHSTTLQRCSVSDSDSEARWARVDVGVDGWDLAECFYTPRHFFFSRRRCQRWVNFIIHYGTRSMVVDFRHFWEGGGSTGRACGLSDALETQRRRWC
ncbi:hypothetical protein EDB87DRAFT_1637540 [Lactarius vividus]|nr:hypothetical protein EDB87DRAFT_1637540 [Lactarius vividus]